jgi:hypothetical protein
MEETMTTHGVRNTMLAVAFGLAGPLALAGLLVATPADAQVKAKTGCPNVIAAKCAKNQHRECRQTDSKGCCKKSACVPN